MRKELANELPRFEALLRSAQDQLDQASTDERIASARVEIFQAAVDIARGQRLPVACQDALEVLVDHAAEEWLSRNPSPDDPDRRRDFVKQSLEAQLLARLFRPDLDLIDEFEVDEREPHAAHLLEVLSESKRSLN